MSLLILPNFNILKRFSCLLTICLLIPSCSTSQLPEILPLASKSNSTLEKKCDRIFLKKKVQLVHALEVQLAGESRSAVIGVTIIDPKKQILESVLMSIEGLVLFHSKVSPSSKEVLRSIEPFTLEDFRDGLLRDIRLIFLKPDGTLMHFGTTRCGNRICRYTGLDKTVDIELLKDGNWIISLYDSRKKLSKTIVAYEVDNASNDDLKHYPRKLVLQNRGIMGYSIIMKLIKAEYLE